MRDDDGEGLHPKAIERRNKSIRQLVIGVFLAGVAAFNLTVGGSEGTEALMWVGVMLLAGGFATIADFKSIVAR